MTADSRRDDLLGAIAVIALLVGTATGNAFAMLGMSVAALVLMTVFCRQRMGSGSLLVVLVAAITAFVIGIVIAMR